MNVFSVVLHGITPGHEEIDAKSEMKMSERKERNDEKKRYIYKISIMKVDRHLRSPDSRIYFVSQVNCFGNRI